jgi:predicted RNase H-like HicB family nuclease
MQLRVQNFIENKLSRAEYKYDESVNVWVGWIKDVPGIYAQSETIEDVRSELAEVLEEYLLMSLQENKTIKGFKGFKIFQHAGAH